MTEQVKSITELRQNLPEFSKDADQNMDRFVITNLGKPQSVLLGYLDYRKMKAATELVTRPEVAAGIRRGLAQQQAGILLTPDEAKVRLKDLLELRSDSTMDTKAENASSGKRISSKRTRKLAAIYKKSTPAKELAKNC